MAMTDEIRKAKKRRRAQIRKAAKKANKTVAEYKAHPGFTKAWPEVPVEDTYPEAPKTESEIREEEVFEEAPEAETSETEEENLFEDEADKKAS